MAPGTELSSLHQTNGGLTDEPNHLLPSRGRLSAPRPQSPPQQTYHLRLQQRFPQIHNALGAPRPTPGQHHHRLQTVVSQIATSPSVWVCPSKPLLDIILCRSGGTCPGCECAKVCKVSTDCKSKYCKSGKPGNVIFAPTVSCFQNRENQPAYTRGKSRTRGRNNGGKPRAVLFAGLITAWLS